MTARKRLLSRINCSCNYSLCLCMHIVHESHITIVVHHLFPLAFTIFTQKYAIFIVHLPCIHSLTRLLHTFMFCVLDWLLCIELSHAYRYFLLTKNQKHQKHALIRFKITCILMFTTFAMFPNQLFIFSIHLLMLHRYHDRTDVQRLPDTPSWCRGHHSRNSYPSVQWIVLWFRHNDSVLRGSNTTVVVDTFWHGHDRHHGRRHIQLRPSAEKLAIFTEECKSRFVLVFLYYQFPVTNF